MFAVLYMQTMYVKVVSVNKSVYKVPKRDGN